MENANTTNFANDTKTKFCKHCAAKIPEDAVICTACGRQVEELKQANNQPQITINNENSSVNTNTNVNTNANLNANRMGGLFPRNKWVAFFLCLFLGFFGAHKFYERKAGIGILYMFTGGLFLIGWFIDLFSILAKPTIYYVY